MGARALGLCAARPLLESVSTREARRWGTEAFVLCSSRLAYMGLDSLRSLVESHRRPAQHSTRPLGSWRDRSGPAPSTGPRRVHVFRAALRRRGACIITRCGPASFTCGSRARSPTRIAARQRWPCSWMAPFILLTTQARPLFVEVELRALGGRSLVALPRLSVNVALPGLGSNPWSADLFTSASSPCVKVGVGKKRSHRAGLCRRQRASSC